MADDGLRVRDRSEEFAALRRGVQRQQEWMRGSSGSQHPFAASASSGGGAGPSPALSGTAVPGAVVTPPWVRVVSHCGELEATIGKKISQMVDMQKDYLRPKFGLASASEGLGDEEKALRIEVMGTEIQKLLKELDRMVKTGVRPADPENGDEVRTAENVQRHLSTRFTRVVASYKDSQTLYADKLKHRTARLKQFKGHSETHQEIEREARVATFKQQGMTQASIDELLLEEAHQQNISSEVEEILRNIQELNSMFTDLRDLVVQQGTMLDRIDFNITQSRANIQKGNVQLSKARKHQCSVQ